MNSKKQEYLLQNIRKRDSGQVEWVGGLFFLLILAILMYTQLQLAAWSCASVYLEDALAASNLASALIDIEEYGKTEKVLIRDEQRAFEIYKEAVRTNLGLDTKWQCENQNLIAGPVEIVDYIIYNVDGNLVEIVRLEEDGEVVERKADTKGKVVAPDGTLVEHTGIYSALSFHVTGFPGMVIRAQKGKLVDIVGEKGEEDEEREKANVDQGVDG